MFNVPQLTRDTLAMTHGLGIDFSYRQCKRIVLTAIRRWEKNPDDYRTITYADPTGEEAVRNVIRSLLVSA